MFHRYSLLMSQDPLWKKARIQSEQAKVNKCVATRFPFTLSISMRRVDRGRWGREKEVRESAGLNRLGNGRSGHWAGYFVTHMATLKLK